MAVTAPLAGGAYHFAHYGALPDIVFYLQNGALVGLFFVLQQALRGQYQPRHDGSYRQNLGIAFLSWNIALAMFLLVGFLTKTSADVSRGSVIAFYLLGFCAVAAVRVVFVAVARHGYRTGWLVEHRVLLVGLDIGGELRAPLDPTRSGMRIADVVTLPATLARDPAALEVAASEAVERARVLNVEDVLLLLPWSYRRVIDAFVEAFLSVPASIYLGPEHDLERFGAVALSNLANAPCLRLEQAPLSPSKRLTKRLFDIVVAATALIMLSPLLILVAVLIRLDSPGPAFFLQRRRGFNHREFRIWKFRTMTTMDDGEVIVQSQGSSDLRVTKVGLPPPPQHRRAASAHQRVQGLDVDRRPSPARGGHDKHYETHRPLCPPPQRAARHHRLGAGQRLPWPDREQREDGSAR